MAQGGKRGTLDSHETTSSEVRDGSIHRWPGDDEWWYCHFGGFVGGKLLSADSIRRMSLLSPYFWKHPCTKKTQTKGTFIY